MPYSPVLRHLYSSQVASNDPCEDRRSWHALSDGASWLLGIYDGHAGYACSDLVSRRLPARLVALLGREGGEAGSTGGGKKDPIQRICNVMTHAYTSLDKEILREAKEIYLSPPPPGDDSLTSVRRVLEPALAGSCALLSLVDSTTGRIFTACTGDARIILGIWDGSSWRAKRLSEDQTARNPLERERIIQEHPEEDPAVLLARNRVLGGLEPTRAFGDARYKWDAEVTNHLTSTYLPGARGAPKRLLTPPYVTAQPVVSQLVMDEQCRFIVMATDGLWDQLEDEEVVQVIGGHLDPKTRDDVRWSYEDPNLATSLIRNALGGKDVERVGRLLALPAPYSRRYRDDITVTVAVFGDEVGSKEWNDRVREVTGA